MSDTDAPAPVRHRVQLAFPYAGHDADEIIEVDADEATRLLYEGKARLPDDEEHRVVASSGVTDVGGVVGERGAAQAEAATDTGSTTKSRSTKS